MSIKPGNTIARDGGRKGGHQTKDAGNVTMNYYENI
jgi:hypothetical protein